MIASSCSTTTTVLPRSRSCRMAPSSWLMSRGCRPIDGSFEHVEHAHQAGTERRSQRDAACLAAAKSPQRAVEREVAEPHGIKIPEPGLYLFEHHAADLPLVVGELQPTEEHGGVANLHRADFANIPAANPRRQGLGPQTGSTTRETNAKTPPAAQEHADVHLVLPPFEPGEEAFQAAELPFRHAVGDQPHLLHGKLPEGHFGRNVVIAGQGEQLLQFVRVCRRIPRRHGPLAERFFRIGNDQLHVQRDHVAEPFAFRARAQRAVETIQPRFRHRIPDARNSRRPTASRIRFAATACRR